VTTTGDRRGGPPNSTTVIQHLRNRISALNITRDDVRAFTDRRKVVYALEPNRA
jgi:hypothetical protein